MSLVAPDGPLTIVVSGSVVSTRIVRFVAALWLPAASVVRAVYVCVPSLTGVTITFHVPVPETGELPGR